MDKDEANTDKDEATMDKDTVWATVDAERAALADLLESLDPPEWEHASLCEGWRVRDVAAHLALSHGGVRETAVAMVRARGSFARMIHDTAVAHAAAPPEQLVAEIRGLLGSRRHAPGTTHLEPLLDVLVHTQDVAVPLGRAHEMPPEAAAVAATRVWTMGFPFHARRRLTGLHLAASDIAWSAGEGAPVHGPIAAILLLLTGRPAGLAGLSGEGVPGLAARLGPAPSARP